MPGACHYQAWLQELTVSCCSLKCLELLHREMGRYVDCNLLCSEDDDPMSQVVGAGMCFVNAVTVQLLRQERALPCAQACSTLPCLAGNPQGWAAHD